MRVLALLAALALAGCAAPSAPATLPQPEAGAPALTTDAVDWQATVAPSLCHNGPVVFTCGATFTFGGWDQEPTYLHDGQGRDLAGGNLSLAWEPLTPTTNALRATVYVLEGCPDECAVNRTLTSGAGESPILLEIPPRDLGKAQAVAVRVQTLPLAGATRATAQQDVHLTGSLLFAEDPDGDPEEADDEESDEA